MTTSKIQPSHRERLACIYVRQSTLKQVAEHTESTQRQYALRERALELGWSASRLEIIDEDQGRSGRSATHRRGFQRLVAQVSLGQVGLVLMLEASRLARSCSDWHHLIELCGVSRTLIADESAVYDPRQPNDRLLLGVKGTLSEAELFTLRTRLYEGRWNKARKGLLAFPLPVGYVRGADGAWQKDPDAQVHARLAYLFAAFRRLGTARAVVREFRQQGLLLPTRVATGEGYGSLHWKTATLSAVVRILSNPAYAGAYVYGRYDYAGERRSRKTGKALARQRPPEAWPVNIADHHPGYISWEVFMENRERLRQNWNRSGSRGVARQGPALLQGIVYCGICGRKMGVQHRAAREKRSSSYLCQGGYPEGAAHICQSMTSRGVDAAVAEAFLEAVSPLCLEVSMQVVDRIEADLAAQRRQWQLQLEQARYEARLAQRQYDAVDPEHRLVAAELERRWNEKLARVAHLEQAYAEADERAPWQLTAEERSAIAALSQDLPALWQAETTTHADRKELVRLALESVQLDGKRQPGQIEVQLHWRSGYVTRLAVKRAAPGEGSLKTPEGAVALIHELAATHSYAAIAEALNAAGWRSAFGRRFTRGHVGYICRRDGIGRGKRRRGQTGTAPQERLIQADPMES